MLLQGLGKKNTKIPLYFRVPHDCVNLMLLASEEGFHWQKSSGNEIFVWGVSCLFLQCAVKVI